MTSKILEFAYPAGSYQKNGEEKTQWSNIGALYKSQPDDGSEPSYFLKFDSLALNPSILMQLMKMKKDAGREVLISAFEPKDRQSSGSNSSRTEPDKDDQMPF